MRKRFDGAKVAVCLELAKGPIVSALLEHDFFVIFLVQPSLLAKYRAAFTPSHAKDDPTDAEFALELMLRYPDRVQRVYFPQVLGLFREKDTGVFAGFLERWATLKAAKKARRSVLEAFFREHNVRYQATIDR